MHGSGLGKMDLSAALRWRGLAMTVLESHDERESLMGITNFLNEMTYSKVFDTLCSKFLFCHFVLRRAFARC